MCPEELQVHSPPMIKGHMDHIFKHLKCKQCASESYIVTKKGSLMIVTHCNDCQSDSQHYWFSVVK